MSGDIAVVREMSGNWPFARKLSRKNLVRETVTEYAWYG